VVTASTSAALRSAAQKVVQPWEGKAGSEFGHLVAKARDRLARAGRQLVYSPGEAPEVDAASQSIKINAEVRRLFKKGTRERTDDCPTGNRSENTSCGYACSRSRAAEQHSATNATARARIVTTGASEEAPEESWAAGLCSGRGTCKVIGTCGTGTLLNGEFCVHPLLDLLTLGQGEALECLTVNLLDLLRVGGLQKIVVTCDRRPVGILGRPLRSGGGGRRRSVRLSRMRIRAGRTAV
jgi:hypothetical protein